jgi:hypothetical protein
MFLALSAWLHVVGAVSWLPEDLPTCVLTELSFVGVYTERANPLTLHKPKFFCEILISSSNLLMSHVCCRVVLQIGSLLFIF